MIEQFTSIYPTKAAFCAEMTISPQFLHQIEIGKRPIPPSLAIMLNKKHGADLHRIRPDIYPAVA